MRGECRASGDGSLYTVPSCELSDVKTKIMLNIGCCSAQLRCGAAPCACASHESRLVGSQPQTSTTLSGALSSQLSLVYSRLSLSLFRFFPD